MKRRLPKKAVAERYDSSEMTIDRTRKEDPDFPEPIQLRPGGKLLWLEEELDEYDQQKAHRVPPPDTELSPPTMEEREVAI